MLLTIYIKRPASLSLFLLSFGELGRSYFYSMWHNDIFVLFYKNYTSWLLLNFEQLTDHMINFSFIYNITIFKLIFQEYLLADKNMSILPVSFSLMASFMSAITLLGVSSENYTYGIQFVIINLSYGIFTPVAAYLYLPVFFRLQATSAYEVL